MALPKPPVLNLISSFAKRLRFPQLFLFTATLFILDVLIPDFIPFADEILLGLATLLLGSWKQQRQADKEPSPPPPASPKNGDGPVIDI